MAACLFSAMLLSVTMTACSVTYIALDDTPAESSSAPTASADPASSTPTTSVSVEDLPASLQQKMADYPEATEYAMAYVTEANKHHEIDLTDAYTPGEIPLFIQWDARWGYETYGDDMIGITGCGPTCLSMVVVGLTGDTSQDPLTVARFSEKNGYYTSGVGTAWTLMTDGAEKLGLSVDELPADKNAVRSYLEDGQPIICSVSTGDFTVRGHFIVLTGLAEDGKVTVNDPNSRINSNKTWDIDRILGQANALWAYSK